MYCDTSSTLTSSPPSPHPSPPKSSPKRGGCWPLTPGCGILFVALFAPELKYFPWQDPCRFEKISGFKFAHTCPAISCQCPPPPLQLQQRDPPRRQQLSEISQLKSRARTLHFFTHLSCKSFFGHLGHVFPAYYCHSCLICVTNSTAPSCH